MNALTFIPVDLGSPIGIAQRMREICAFLETYDWKLVSGREDFLEQHDDRLLLTRTGIAVLIRSWHVDADVPSLCERRRMLHENLINEQENTLPEGFLEAIRKLRRHLHAKQPRSRRRLTQTTFIHYAFTAFVLDDMPSTSDLYALLEPALIGYPDTGEYGLIPDQYTDALAEGRPINDSNAADIAGSFALRTRIDANCTVYASWSSLVIVGITDDKTMDAMILTEANIQAAWLAAWLTQTMAEQVLDTPIREVNEDWIAWQCLEFSGMSYSNDHRANPSENSAMQHFRFSLEVTSGLVEEWNVALRATDRAQQIGMLICRERESRRSAMLDILLLILSITSLVQVIFAVPIINWVTFIEHPWETAMLVVFFISGTTLIVRRRR